MVNQIFIYKVINGYGQGLTASLMQTRKISEYGWFYCFKENSVIGGGTLSGLNEGIKKGDIKKATPDNVYTEARINRFVAKVKARYPDCQIII